MCIRIIGDKMRNVANSYKHIVNPIQSILDNITSAEMQLYGQRETLKYWENNSAPNTKVRCNQTKYEIAQTIKQIEDYKRKKLNYEALNKIDDNYKIGKKNVCENERERLRLTYS